jgi:MarR family transcriptional regulator, organic hydroperoxide resistance regulator
MSSGPDDRRGEDLGVLLVSVSARLNRLYGRVLGQLDPPLTFRQHRLLRRIDEGHTSMAALAAFGNLTVPTVSESVEGLVRRGLLNRQENPQNRRSILLTLTPAGREAKEAGDAVLATASDRLLRAVPEEHRQVLHESLAAVFDAATEVFQQADSATPAAARVT